MPKETAEQLEFYGMEEVLGVFADAYVVAHSRDAFTLYFFQSQSPKLATERGETFAFAPTKYKCVGRIVLAGRDSFDKFLRVMASNRGATIKFPENEEKAEEAK